jgi:hypothetical protein
MAGQGQLGTRDTNKEKRKGSDDLSIETLFGSGHLRSAAGTSGGPVAGTSTTTCRVEVAGIEKEIGRICLCGVGRRTVVPKNIMP